MLKLKSKILDFYQAHQIHKSPEAEANLILLHVFHLYFPEIESLNDLKTIGPLASVVMEGDVDEILKKRATGTPLQHILGNQFFYEHEYLVNASTLIPRPETEILVNTAIEWIERNLGAAPFRFAELGLGSGIISGEILARFPKSSAIASEVNSDAIDLAKKNLKSVLGSDFEKRIQILKSNQGLTGFEIFNDHGPFDVIFSNPPYVSKNDEIEGEVLKHEPHAALFPESEAQGENPNYFYENFLKNYKNTMKNGGFFFFEIPHERAEALMDLFSLAPFSALQFIEDLTGRKRVLCGILK